MIKYMSNRFYNREMKPYRSNQAINPSKIAEIFSSISNMDTQEITNTANRLQIPLGVTDENGDTLIHKILKDETKQKNEVNRLNIVQFLYNNNVSPDSPNKENITPLHLACYYQYTLIIKYLIEIGADPNYKDILGNTAFHYYLNGLLKNYTNNFIIDLIPQENLPKLKEGIKTNAIEKRIFDQISTDPLIDTLKNTIIKSTGLNEDLEFEFNEYLKKTTGLKESGNIKEFNETVNDFFTSISEKIKNLWKQFNDIDEIELHIKNKNSWPNLPNSTQAVIKDLENGNIHDTIKSKIQTSVDAIANSLNGLDNVISNRTINPPTFNNSFDNSGNLYSGNTITRFNINTGFVRYKDLYNRELFSGCADGADNYIDTTNKFFIGGARTLDFQYLTTNLENNLYNLFQQNEETVLKTLAKSCIEIRAINLTGPFNAYNNNFVGNANPHYLIDKIVYTLLMTTENISDNEINALDINNNNHSHKTTKRVYQINKNNDKLNSFKRAYNLVLNRHLQYNNPGDPNRNRLTPQISDISMYFFAGYLNYQTNMILSMTQAMKTLLIRRLTINGNLLLSTWVYLLLSSKNYHRLYVICNNITNPGNLTTLNATLRTPNDEDYIPAVIANYCFQLFNVPNADPGVVAGVNLTDALRDFTGINYTNRFEMLIYAITKYNEGMSQKPILNHVIDTIFIIRKTYSEQPAQRGLIINNYIKSLDLGTMSSGFVDIDYINFFNNKIMGLVGKTPAEILDNRRKFRDTYSLLKLEDDILPSRKMIYLWTNEIMTVAPPVPNVMVKFFLRKFYESNLLGLGFINCFPKIREYREKMIVQRLEMQILLL
jgi:hypothetical protein